MHPSIGVLACKHQRLSKIFDAVKRDNLRFNLDTANQFFMKDKYHNDCKGTFQLY